MHVRCKKYQMDQTFAEPVLSRVIIIYTTIYHTYMRTRVHTAWLCDGHCELPAGCKK